MIIIQVQTSSNHVLCNLGVLQLPDSSVMMEVNVENWKEPQLWGGRWGEDYFLGLCELHTLLLDFTTKSEWPLAAALF